jgi:enamine deaminase RidA (YjgF/YER057c/UK114 family)
MKTSTPEVLINPPGTEKIYERMQFSQAVQSGNMLWISGQVGFDESGKAVEGIGNQARMAFTNLGRLLEEAGGGFF